MHLECLGTTGLTLFTSEGHEIEVWELAAPSAEQLSSWARSFRQNYCLDEDVDRLRAGTGLSRADYLINLVFPDESMKPGPSIRAGDFAELLISDYVEMLGYWVPRGKYAEKASRNESVKGIDILGFRHQGVAPDPEDALLAFEVKAQLTGVEYAGKLQVAIDDSSKDFYLRRGTTLNALKRRLIDRSRFDEADAVSRFQNPTDNPYRYKSGAALVVTGTAYDQVGISLSSVMHHNNKQDISLLVVKGENLMDLVHHLYRAAANEA
ncbi:MULTISPECIES: virulence associated protein [unclassified Stenotrophomonas]|uniref:virulence associated protein n=1 Tax=unclassified Stenotrophomonas TaxID=196198 RepID=UPI002118D422|nr:MULTISPECIES: virulence associated protein [unclassified Stenotrophomonas]